MTVSPIPSRRRDLRRKAGDGMLSAAFHPRSAEYKRARQEAVSYVQPSVFDMLAGARPASAMDGWAE